MATCIKCNASIPEGSLFCNHCGAKQELVCAACGAALPGGSKFCNQCGAPVGGAAEAAKTAKVCATRPFSKEWEDFMNRGKIVGDERYHFVYDDGNVYRIDSAGAVTKVPDVPSGDYCSREDPLVWAENKVWYAVNKDHRYYLHTLDPETLVWSLEAEIEKDGISSAGISAPYVTPDYLWFTGEYSYGGGSSILVLNRKTWMNGAVEAGRVDQLGGGCPRSVGKKEIWVEHGVASYFMNWWRSDRAGISRDERIKPLLPLMAGLSGTNLPMGDEYEDLVERSAFAKAHIQYIDFEKELVYFTCCEERPWDGKGYTLPFGATDPGQAELFWAGGDGIEKILACNGRYIVGATGKTEKEDVYELALRKADGTMVTFGSDHPVNMDNAMYNTPYYFMNENPVVLVNDAVYVYRWYRLEGRYILRPGADKPEFQKLELD